MLTCPKNGEAAKIVAVPAIQVNNSLKANDSPELGTSKCVFAPLQNARTRTSGFAATALHEAYLRLVGKEDECKWNHRGHFYGAAARAMRQILVESARRKKSLKRGGDGERLPLNDELLVSSGRHPDLLELDAALDNLAVERPDLVELVSLRFFAGLTMDQAAKAIGISKRSAERNWTFARAWLLHAIRSRTC